MSSPVDKIKERLSVVDVISSYIEVIQAGKNFKAKCPFHNEKTPSFFISSDRGTYYCFGCGAKGDIFSFVENFEGTDFLGALKILAERAGVPLVYDKNENKKDKEIYYEIMESATIFFEANFKENKEARSYLILRGINDESIKNFRIGFAKDSWRSLSTYLIDKGYKKSDLEIVGLIKTKEDGGYYDRFRERIIFPILDSSGRVIAFTGRIFTKDKNKEKEEAKYLNSPDTPLFNKANILFGIDKAKNSIRKMGYSIVVEGQMDLILSHQIGFTNTVAVSGTALNDSTYDNEANINSFGLIRRLSQNVIFAFDGDSAGERASVRSSIIALSLDMQVKLASLSSGRDPADIIKENGDEWKDIIKNSKNVIHFYVDKICKDNDDLRKRGLEIRSKIFPLINVIKSSIEKSSYLTYISGKSGIPSRAIIEDFDSYKSSGRNEVKEIMEKRVNKDVRNRKDNLEQKLFGIIFWLEGFNDYKSKIESYLENFDKDIFEKIRHKYEKNGEPLIFESEMFYEGKIDDAFRDLK
ncbi:TPA: DNA primase, partial [Candidatus Nomurabacteria bacterium]|nr:DNA primase [Candidatus Nomurabacteria bacterium]